MAGSQPGSPGGRPAPEVPVPEPPEDKSGKDKKNLDDEGESAAGS